ncbi:hypothetical protein MNB_SUP05-SYMBIONT-5-1426 [hydrothermal vent metagenome]|uniref:Lipoprotein n=1 Tax=hydrothermal vent metagenome TaxID=652676 RepID=A0A1W1E5F0_9ZZZZ
MKKIFLIGILITLLSSCTNVATLDSKTFERTGISVVQSSPGSKFSIIKDGNNSQKFCAPREADFSFTSSKGFDLAVLGKGEEIGEKSTRGSLSLGGRDPAVLILRELVYRACELSVNSNSTKEQTVKIYKDFLHIARKMMQDQAKATATGVVGFNPNLIKPSDLIKPVAKEILPANNRSSAQYIYDAN